MNRITLTAMAIFLATVVIGCSKSEKVQSSSPARSATAGSAEAPAQSQQDSGPNACTLLTQADAEAVLGATMKAKPQARPSVCIYEETSPKGIPATLALTVNARGSEAVENGAWAGFKEVRHFHAGAKNVQVLSDIGQEAYWDGHIEHGKAQTAALAARTPQSDFVLDLMLLEYRASPEAMKTTAKKIATQLK
jgi:hypothetical protein